MRTAAVRTDRYEPTIWVGIPNRSNKRAVVIACLPYSTVFGGTGSGTGCADDDVPISISRSMVDRWQRFNTEKWGITHVGDDNDDDKDDDDDSDSDSDTENGTNPLPTKTRSGRLRVDVCSHRLGHASQGVAT